MLWSYQKTYGILKEILIRCQKIDKNRGIISKYLNNQYGFDTDQSEQMPVPQKGHSNFNHSLPTTAIS